MGSEHIERSYTDQTMPEAVSPQRLHEQSLTGGEAGLETFLGQHADTFRLIEELWEEAREARDQVREALTTPLAPHRVVDEAGRVIVQWERVQAGEGRALRRRAEDRNANPRQIMAQVNQEAYDFVQKSTLAELDKTLQKETVQNQEDIAKLADASMQSWSDAMKALANQPGTLEWRRKKMLEGQHFPSDMGQAESNLRVAYHRAFIAQHIGIRRIQELLVDEAVVLPLMELIQEIAPLARQGVCEFPGLLETLATHAMSDLEASLVRSLSGTTFTKEAFMTALFKQGVEAVSPRRTDLPREFIGGVAAAQAMAKAVSIEVDTPQTHLSSIVQYMVRRFDDLPDEWNKMYQLYTITNATHISHNLRALLAPFMREGRLRSNVRIDDDVQGKGTRQSAPKRKGKLTGSPGKGQAQRATLDVEDIAAQNAETEPLASFAILKGVGGSNTHFGLERVPSFDDLLQHSIVTNFLQAYRGEPGLEASLRSFLERIARDPYDRTHMTVIHRRYSLTGPGIDSSVKYRLRRFNPRQSNIEDGIPKSAFIGRVRILFGIAALEGQRHLLIDSISLRKESTF